MNTSGWHVKNLNVAIFVDTIMVITVEHCVCCIFSFPCSYHFFCVCDLGHNCFSISTENMFIAKSVESFV